MNAAPAPLAVIIVAREEVGENEGAFVFVFAGPVDVDLALAYSMASMRGSAGERRVCPGKTRFQGPVTYLKC